MSLPDDPTLTWTPLGGVESGCEVALLGDYEGGDGVRFYLQRVPTCYRRGPHKLLVDVARGKHHHLWGCFDDADQPMRWFHKEENLKGEAQEIARVLLTDRRRAESPRPTPTDRGTRC